MKRLICIALLCLLLAGLIGCGQAPPPEETAAAPETFTFTTGVVPVTQPNKWGVSIEHIDLSKPENKKHLDWAKKDYENRGSYPNTFKTPKYFDVEAYRKAYWEQENKKPDPWVYVWEDEKAGKLREKHRPWNETKELVIRSTYESECEGYRELLVRDKTTGETERIARGYFADYDGVVFDQVKILSDKQFLYHIWYWDGGDWGYYIYDLELGESICVSGGYNLCDLGDGRYLWADTRYVNVDGVSTLHLIDWRAFDAEKQDAKCTLVNWGDNYAVDIRHLSSDKRFVYVDLYRVFDGKRCRGVYDINTGEQVAFFEMPDPRMDRWVLISDDLEYAYYSAGIENNQPEHSCFHIIRYDQKQ